MKIRRADDPEISFIEADAVLQSYGVAAFKIDRRDGRFQVTPVLCDGSEQRIFDLTSQFEKYQQEQRR